MWWFDPVRAREGNIREGTDESGLGGKAKRKSSPRCRLQLLGGYLRVCGWTCPRRVGSSSSGSRRESHRPHELRPCEVVDFTVAFLVPTRRRTSRGKLWVFNVFGCLFLGTWGGGGVQTAGASWVWTQRVGTAEVWTAASFSTLLLLLVLRLLLLLLLCSFCSQNVASRTAAEKKNSGGCHCGAAERIQTLTVVQVE